MICDTEERGRLCDRDHSQIEGEKMDILEHGCGKTDINNDDED